MSQGEREGRQEGRGGESLAGKNQLRDEERGEEEEKSGECPSCPLAQAWLFIQRQVADGAVPTDRFSVTGRQKERVSVRESEPCRAKSNGLHLCA